MGCRGFEDIENFQNAELGEVEKVDDSRSQSGGLELACRTKIAVFYGVFGMGIVDAEGQEKEDEDKGEIEEFLFFSSHRIPNDNNINENNEESQSLAELL
jgi:hypothetical protein